MPFGMDSFDVCLTFVSCRGERPYHYLDMSRVLCIIADYYFYLTSSFSDHFIGIHTDSPLEMTIIHSPKSSCLASVWSLDGESLRSQRNPDVWVTLGCIDISNGRSSNTTRLFFGVGH